MRATFAALLFDKSLNSRRSAVNLHQQLLKPLLELGLPSAELVEGIVKLMDVVQNVAREPGRRSGQRDHD